MDRVALLGVVLALGGCSTFFAAESSDTDTDATSADETGQTTLPPTGTTDPSPTSGADSDSDDPGPTTEATTDPSATGNPTTDPTGEQTTSGGGAESTTGGNSSTGSDPTDDSSTGDPPTSCGDSIPQDDEACDDGNSDELDGCTSSCEVGPTAIDYGATLTSELDGGSGTSGISDNTHECPAGEVLVGLQGDLTAEPWIGVIGGICRPTALTNTDPPEFATGAPPTVLPEHGGFSGGGPWSTECGADEVIVAVQGGAGTVIDGLQIRCASIDTIGAPGAYDLEATAEARFEALQGGSGGGPFGPLTCPDGTVAAGLRTRTNSYVIQVELRCRELGLTY